MALRCIAVLACSVPLIWGAEPFDQAKRLAFQSPSQALAMLQELGRDADRATIERLAILRAASVDRPLAATRIPQLLNVSPWIGDIVFADAIALAQLMNGHDGEALLVASAARHPEAALQSAMAIDGLPYAASILETAAIYAPDEAVSLMAGASLYSMAVSKTLSGSDIGAIKRLVRLAHDQHVAAPLRTKLAFADLPLPVVQDSASYFHALAERRLKSQDIIETTVLDRGLTTAATALCQTYQQAPQRAPEINRLSTRDLYLLLSYARAGDEDTYFASLFDQLVARDGLMASIEQAQHLRLREFVEYVLWFRRYPKLLAVAGSNVLVPLFKRLELDPALTAADAIASTPEPARRTLKLALAAIPTTDASQEIVKRSLASSLTRPIGSATPLSLAALTDSSNTVLQRYFFYDDADGVDSFEGFRAQYAHDRAWHWEEMEGWVRLTSLSKAPAIEIVANVPVNALSLKNTLSEAERAQRQDNVTAYLGDREPTVIVHRGHAYHVEKTLRYVTRGTRLVYLGSCRGLKEIRSAMESSPRADIISTRAVGTRQVNDPLLKMLNLAILRGNIDWPSFWNAASLKFAANEDFPSYIPPHRNGAAAFLRLYDSIDSIQK